MSYDDDEPISNARIYRKATERLPLVPLALAGGVLLIAVITVLSLFVWHVDGWFQQHTTERNAKIAQSNYGTQTGFVGYIAADVSAITANIAVIGGGTSNAGILAQDIHSGNDACSYAAKLTPGEITITPSMQTWINVNCAAGALTSSSNVYKGGNGE